MRPTFEQVKKMLDKMNPHKVSPVDMMMNLVTALCNIINQNEKVFQIVIIITDKRKKKTILQHLNLVIQTMVSLTADGEIQQTSGVHRG